MLALIFFMEQDSYRSIINFITNITNDTLRHIYVRGRYRDVILPMVVIKRLDCLLSVGDRNITNTSGLLLRDILNYPDTIKQKFLNYLNGFDANVIDIIQRFGFFEEVDNLDKKNILYPVIQKFTSDTINLSPYPVKDDQGNILHSPMTSEGMGYLFEELIKQFNEENSLESGEHYTPKDVIELMTKLLFNPVKHLIQDKTYTVYDCTSGTGGMLVQAEKYLQQLAKSACKNVSIELFGQEINGDTYGVSKANALISGRGNMDVRYGSTISDDQFKDCRFDFMIANPPYGKNWKLDQSSLIKSKQVIDSRFTVEHQGSQLNLLPKVSDGQLLFLVNNLSKMVKDTDIGSRIAIIHNASPLFAGGEPGTGENNIRKWIIENDWLDCIIALPGNMFYNTGISTYIWLLTNKKSKKRQGKIQLIDASKRFEKMRKNLGNKNCYIPAQAIDDILQEYQSFEDSDTSKVINNQEFGYHKITVERPIRWSVQLTDDNLEIIEKKLNNGEAIADLLVKQLGYKEYLDFNLFKYNFEYKLRTKSITVKPKDLDFIYNNITTINPEAKPVLEYNSKSFYTYKPDPKLKDSEKVPLGVSIEKYFKDEVLRHVPDAWIGCPKDQVGYEILFTKYFYKPPVLRKLEDIAQEIKELDASSQELLREILEWGDE